ncbi:MAG TPA: trigger factor [Spirochaetota bacterium]|nr:trigger factor [Spirochaetota bacterium]HPQ51936.1 trigger factor [Spirochaetota bacterium]
MQILDEKKLENATIEMKIEVPESRVEVEYKSVFEKISKGAKVDGFRKGKAPISLVENKYKSNADQEVLENLLRYTYVEALKEKDHNPVSDPMFDWEPLERGKPFTYSVKFEISPSVELSNYKGVDVKQRSCEISDKDINREIEALQFKNAKIAKKPDGQAIANGDQVKIKMKRIDNIPADQVDSQEFKDFTFICGKSKSDLSMDQYVLGMGVDETKEVEMKYPKDYEVKDLAGQKVKYIIQIAEINTVDLPALDDEFAKDLGEHESLDALKKSIREHLENYISDVIRNETVNSILKDIVEKSTFDIPESLVRSEMSMIFDRLRTRVGLTEVTIPDFSSMMGMDTDEFVKTLREEAIGDIKSFMVRLEIAKKEDIKYTEEQYNEMLDSLAQRSGKTPEEMSKIIEMNNSKANLETELMMKNTQDFLMENAKIKKSKTVSLEDFMKGDTSV